MCHSKVSKQVYEISIAILALAAIIITVFEDAYPQLKTVNVGILTIFVIDYFIRFSIATDKVVFIQSNILDLIAIIPLGYIKVFRLVKAVRILKLTKVIRVLRIFTFTKRFHSKVKEFLATNGFIYMVYITLATTIIGSFVYYTFERNHVLATYQDALWLSFSTMTLFGYEGVEKISAIGKTVAAMQIIVGIVFTGMFTATSATFFIRQKSNKQSLDCELGLSELTEDEKIQVKEYIEFIRYRKQTRGTI